MPSGRGGRWKGGMWKEEKGQHQSYMTNKPSRNKSSVLFWQTWWEGAAAEWGRFNPEFLKAPFSWRLPVQEPHMVRVVAELCQLHANPLFGSPWCPLNPFLFSVTACRPNDRKSPWPYPFTGSSPHNTSPTPLTHIVLAGDVAQDGIALMSLFYHPWDRAAGKKRTGQMNNLSASCLSLGKEGLQGREQ